jgi:hypothetical protein
LGHTCATLAATDQARSSDGTFASSHRV